MKSIPLSIHGSAMSALVLSPRRAIISGRWADAAVVVSVAGGALLWSVSMLLNLSSGLARWDGVSLLGMIISTIFIIKAFGLISKNGRSNSSFDVRMRVPILSIILFVVSLIMARNVCLSISQRDSSLDIIAAAFLASWLLATPYVVGIITIYVIEAVWTELDRLLTHTRNARIVRKRILAVVARMLVSRRSEGKGFRKRIVKLLTNIPRLSFVEMRRDGKCKRESASHAKLVSRAIESLTLQISLPIEGSDLAVAKDLQNWAFLNMIPRRESGLRERMPRNYFRTRAFHWFRRVRLWWFVTLFLPSVIKFLHEFDKSWAAVSSILHRLFNK